MADIKDKLKKLFSKKEESVGEKAGEALAKAGLKAMAEKLKGKDDRKEIKNNMTQPKEDIDEIPKPKEVKLPDFDLPKIPTIQDKFEKYKGTNRGMESLASELDEKVKKRTKK